MGKRTSNVGRRFAISAKDAKGEKILRRFKIRELVMLEDGQTYYLCDETDNAEPVLIRTPIADEILRPAGFVADKATFTSKAGAIGKSE